ncbi:metallophosphoesterase [Cellulosilyticum ruminicola]|uniref:metallophosphoesterase n=1 Tax=Cellulosilyticum ruminicola TaxID=425254 RepID=UPI0006CFB268|nr:metallophosphoesterase [Cellulosilyticum ruminicola]
MKYSKLTTLIRKILFCITITTLSVIYLIGKVVYFIDYNNNHIEIARYNIQSSKIPESFSGYRIVHLSDLHSKYFGSEQEKLVGQIKAQHPNIIVVTGDLVDGKTKFQEPCLTLMKKLVDIAPTYYTYGNHEALLLYEEAYQSYFKNIEALGVHIMNSKSVILTNETEETINLIGVPDPIAIPLPNDIFYYSDQEERTKILLENTLSLVPHQENYTILLCHRPEYINTYSNFPVDLALCGHTHGGQVRLPIIGALYASGQGFFPKYDTGLFKKDQLTLIISSGLGSSSIPFRILDFPEIGVLTLTHQ